MIWTVLGAGSILPREGYGCSGHAWRSFEGGEVTLFDCGPGTVRSLAGHGIQLSEVRRVVLSHFHPDHCLDLLALAFARRNPRSEAGPIELVGPRGLGDWLAGSVGAQGRWVEFEEATVLEVEPTPEPVPVHSSVEGSLTAVRTRHTETSLAWRIGAGRDSVVYSGDAREEPELVRLAMGCGLFVCECSGLEADPVPGHLTAAGAGRLAREAGVGRLCLTHFYPDIEPELAREEAATCFPGPIELARDGSRHLVEVAVDS